MVELTLLVARDGVEAVSDALMDHLDALSVSVEDADSGTDAEHALFGEPGMATAEGAWQRSIVKALFDSAAAASEAANSALVLDGIDGIDLLSITPVPDCDWVRLTQSQFAPVAVTPSFWIVPTWHQPPPQATLVIRLDPGLAFGTGTHPTTRMCLRWTAAHAPRLAASWGRVLDYGCGSGILAIGAALHGGREIDAVDIDPAAISAAQANAIANGVTLHCGAPDGASGSYDLVYANILASPLKLLAPVLCAHLRPDADLLLAGLLERQADALKTAYAPWLALDIADAEDGWILLSGRRRG